MNEPMNEWTIHIACKYLIDIMIEIYKMTIRIISLLVLVAVAAVAAAVVVLVVLVVIVVVLIAAVVDMMR